jgi:HSP20 family molecular chaperone IbpA
MTQLVSHSFESRYEAPANRRSIRIRPLVVATDEETGESPRRKAITRLRAGIHEAVNRWLHRMRRRTSDTQGRRGQFPAFLRNGDPSIDLEETSDEIVVLAELPGLDAGDFEIETDGRRLMLHGHKKEESEERGHRSYYAERRFGAFHAGDPPPLPGGREQGKRHIPERAPPDRPSESAGGNGAAAKSSSRLS